MSLEQELAGPEPFTHEELAGAKKLKDQLSHCSLPPDLCTEFGLARWWRATKGNFTEAEQRIKELANHLKAFRMDKLEQVLDKGTGQKFAQQVYERFAISKLDEDVFSGDTLVFLQRMEGVDIKNILRVVPLGSILEAYAQLQLNWLRAVVTQEKRTGRPATVAAVIDLRGLPFKDFINPLSPASRMARLIVRIWSEYFGENLVRLYLVHPPGLLSILWQVTKHIMDQRTWSKIIVVHKGPDLLNFLVLEAVPEDYGGTRRDESGFSASPSSCVSAPKPVLSHEHFEEERWWRETQGVTGPIPDRTTIQLKGRSSHESEQIECLPGDHLLWLFTSSGDIHFELAFFPEDIEQEIPVWPRAIVSSLSIPEHGAVECLAKGKYFARFAGLGHSGWFGMLSQGTNISYVLHKRTSG